MRVLFVQRLKARRLVFQSLLPCEDEQDVLQRDFGQRAIVDVEIAVCEIGEYRMIFMAQFGFGEVFEFRLRDEVGHLPLLSFDPRPSRAS